MRQEVPVRLEATRMSGTLRVIPDLSLVGVSVVLLSASPGQPVGGHFLFEVERCVEQPVRDDSRPLVTEKPLFQPERN